MLLKLTDFHTFPTWHTFTPFKRNGTRLERTSPSAGVFKGHALEKVWKSLEILGEKVYIPIENAGKTTAKLTIKQLDKKFKIIKLLGKGKGGYSYLASDNENEYVVKLMGKYNICPKFNTIF